MSVKRYTLKEAQKILGVTYKTILYYREQYSNEVIQEGRFYYVTENFLNKVKHNRDNNARLISDTKEELLMHQKTLREEIERAKTEAELLKRELNELRDNFIAIPQTEEEILDFIGELYNKLKGMGSESKIELFTEEEYETFRLRLSEWHSQREEIKQQEVRFEQVTASKDEIIEHYKGQFEYQRQLSDKQLDQMDKLLGYLKERNLREAERTHIEAVEKKIIPRETDKNETDPYRSRFR